MVIGEDVAFPVDQEPGPGTAARRLAAPPALGGIVEELGTIAEVKRTRDNTATLRALYALTEAARSEPGEANLMEKILDCARAYATEGEIRGAMREVFGDYTEPAEF